MGFSILRRATLRDQSFTAPRQVHGAIDVFIAVYDPTAHLFEWTKQVVRQAALKPRYAHLQNYVLALKSATKSAWGADSRG